MRIAHCIHGLGLGGAQKVLETIVATLPAPQFEHFVYCALDGPVRLGVEASGATVRILPRRIPKLDPMWILTLMKAMQSDSIDLVHTHLFGDSLHGSLAARAARNRPVVMTLHRAQDRFSRSQQFGYRRLLPRCSAVVACSPSVARTFLEDQPELADRLTVIRNGIRFHEPLRLSPSEAANLRADLGVEPHSSVVLAMGRFVEAKGYEFLIQAMGALPESLRERSQLVLLGIGPLEGQLKALTTALDLSRHVLFPGYRPDVRRILGIAEVVAFSSLWEGLSIALLEAMAGEKCIVATELEAFQDVLEHETEALLVPPRDPAQLGSAISRLLTDPGLRAELGQRARARFVEDFTAQAMVDAYERLYMEVGAGPVGTLRLS